MAKLAHILNESLALSHVQRVLLENVPNFPIYENKGDVVVNGEEYSFLLPCNPGYIFDFCDSNRYIKMLYDVIFGDEEYLEALWYNPIDRFTDKACEMDWITDAIRKRSEEDFFPGVYDFFISVATDFAHNNLKFIEKSLLIEVLNKPIMCCFGRMVFRKDGSDVDLSDISRGNFQELDVYLNVRDFDRITDMDGDDGIFSNFAELRRTYDLDKESALYQIVRYVPSQLSNEVGGYYCSEDEIEKSLNRVNLARFFELHRDEFLYAIENHLLD